MIIPGILETNLESIKAKITQIEAVAPLIQIDIADGRQVEGETYQDVKQMLDIQTNAKLEIHLMVEDPLKYLTSIETAFTHKESPVLKKISTHLENTPAQTISEFLLRCKKIGLKTGLSINPETPLQVLTPYHNQIDFIQLLSVKPGKQGGEYIAETTTKIQRVHERFPNLTIQVDGGIKEQNLQTIIKAGANNVVMGSAIFNTDNPKETLIKFERLINNGKTEIL